MLENNKIWSVFLNYRFRTICFFARNRTFEFDIVAEQRFLYRMQCMVFILQSTVKIHFWFCMKKTIFSGTRSFCMFSIITAYKLFIQYVFFLYKSYVSRVYTHTIRSIRVKLILLPSLLAIVISSHIHGALLLKSILSVPFPHPALKCYKNQTRGIQGVPSKLRYVFADQCKCYIDNTRMYNNNNNNGWRDSRAARHSR